MQPDRGSAGWAYPNVPVRALRRASGRMFFGIRRAGYAEGDGRICSSYVRPRRERNRLRTQRGKPDEDLMHPLDATVVRGKDEGRFMWSTDQRTLAMN